MTKRLRQTWNRSKPMKERSNKKIFPFVVEFAKFATGFAVIVAVALLALRVTGAGVN